MKVARTCAPASARLSLQAMRLSYFKKRFYLLIAEKYNVASRGVATGVPGCAGATHSGSWHT